MRTIRLAVAIVALVLCAGGSALAADTLVWRDKDNSVDADIANWTLPQVLAKVSKATGWKVYVEPGASAKVSVKFKGVSTDDALRRLLGNSSFLITQSNGVSRLYVYHTDVAAATQLVASEKKVDPKDYLIPNELVIRLKKGSKVSIEDLATQVGAKIVGRDDALGLYRLQFADEAATTSGATALDNNANVAWVDSNYLVAPPTPQQVAQVGSSGDFSMDPKQTSDCSPIVGLIDTAVQPQPGYSNYILSPISVVGPVTPSGDVPTHGTGMAETMLRSMSNRPSKIQPVTIYRADASSANGSSESTTTFEVAQGIVAAVNAGANPINLSLGGTGDSAFLKQLIADASAKGIVFVAAAGNQPGTEDTFPAAWPGVVAVTASGADGKLAAYANSGSFVEAMAPGESIVVLGGQAWDMQGTSVATARVTGMLAGKVSQDCQPPAKLTESVINTLPVKR